MLLKNNSNRRFIFYKIDLFIIFIYINPCIFFNFKISSEKIGREKKLCKIYFNCTTVCLNQKCIIKKKKNWKAKKNCDVANV